VCRAAWIDSDHEFLVRSDVRPQARSVIDYDVIRKRINELAEKFKIAEIAIDRWNATQLATQLAGDGFEMVGFGQGFASMLSPTKELERRVLGGELNHGKNPVLR
jgi:phage terminase large subunit-like protein